MASARSDEALRTGVVTPAAERGTLAEARSSSFSSSFRCASSSICRCNLRTAVCQWPSFPENSCLSWSRCWRISSLSAACFSRRLSTSSANRRRSRNNAFLSTCVCARNCRRSSSTSALKSSLSRSSSRSASSVRSPSRRSAPLSRWKRSSWRSNAQSSAPASRRTSHEDTASADGAGAGSSTARTAACDALPAPRTLPEADEATRAGLAKAEQVLSSEPSESGEAGARPAAARGVDVLASAGDRAGDRAPGRLSSSSSSSSLMLMLVFLLLVMVFVLLCLMLSSWWYFR
mmetsp:Transcript_111889/g.355740  ORF Transcript_111889/g.355740 Transcript_111889/m.355740 type:complete len:290 (+) Transcript_111889:1073-1942(+)